MTWEVLGIPYYNDGYLTPADIQVKQSLTFDTAVLLKAVRIWVILYNDPTFTSLTMRIYSSSMYHLFTSTNAQAKEDLLQSGNSSCREIYFEFDDVMLAKDTIYYFVLQASGYIGSSESTFHIAWKSSYPDSIYDTTANTRVEANQYPLEIYPIFARFDEP